MFCQFCMMQNLRSTMTGLQLPPAIVEISTEFDKAYGGNIRGTLFSDQLLGEGIRQKGSASLLSNEVCKLYLSRFGETSRSYLAHSAKTYRRLEYWGYTLATSSTAEKDSHIMLREKSGNWTAGCIQQIFSLPSSGSSGTPFNKTKRLTA